MLRAMDASARPLAAWRAAASSTRFARRACDSASALWNFSWNQPLDSSGVEATGIEGVDATGMAGGEATGMISAEATGMTDVDATGMLGAGATGLIGAALAGGHGGTQDARRKTSTSVGAFRSRWSRSLSGGQQTTAGPVGRLHSQTAWQP